MSGDREHSTITTAYAERLVAAGQAPSVEAVFAAEREEHAESVRRGRELLAKAHAEADPAKVQRMIDSIDRQQHAFKEQNRRP